MSIAVDVGAAVRAAKPLPTDEAETAARAAVFVLGSVPSLAIPRSAVQDKIVTVSE
jgi:hypothetical protein